MKKKVKHNGEHSRVSVFSSEYILPISPLVYSEWVLHDWISSSIIDTQNNNLFDERLPGSNESCPNCLVGSWIGSRLGSFFGSLIGCCYQVKWLTRTWFPATELRLVNAFEWLAERKSANSTKNFKRAGIAFIPLMIIALQMMPNKYFKTQSDYLLCN